MSAILNLISKKITFFWSNLPKLHKKGPNFACDDYIFPETRRNKNKQSTHSTPLKLVLKYGFFFFIKFAFVVLEICLINR